MGNTSLDHGGIEAMLCTEVIYVLMRFDHVICKLVMYKDRRMYDFSYFHSTEYTDYLHL